MAHEYKVIPAPRKGKRGKSAKGPAGRFANAVETALNDMAADGWEFVRAETLGADEREGLMRRRIETFHGVLVFRRALSETDTPATPPTAAPSAPLSRPPEKAPAKPEPQVSATPKPAAKPAAQPPQATAQAEAPAPKPRIRKMAASNLTDTQPSEDPPAER